MQYLKYIGDDYILGQITGESYDGFYWYVKPRPDKKRPVRQERVCHPKWSTEVVEEEEAWQYLKR